MKWLGVTVLLSLVLFAMVGIISSALEIFFVLSTTLLARRLWYLERGGGKNQSIFNPFPMIFSGSV